MNTLRYNLRIVGAWLLGVREATLNLTTTMHDYRMRDAYERGRSWSRWWLQLQ